MVKTALDESIERLFAVQKQLMTITAREDGSHRYDMIQHRRALAAEMVDLSNAAAGDARLNTNASLASSFRQCFSAMRAATALHQSKWPAIDVDPANPEYIGSVQSVRKANKTFADWVKLLPIA